MPANSKQFAWSNLATLIVLITTLVAVFVTPIFFHESPANLKNALFFSGTIALALIFVITALRRHRLLIPRSPLTFILLFLWLATAATILISRFSNFEVAFVGRGGSYLALATFALVGGSLLTIKNNKIIIALTTWLGLAATIFNFIIALLLLISPATLTNFELTAWLSPLSALAVIIIALGGNLAVYLKKGKVSSFTLFILPVLLLGLIANIFILTNASTYLAATRPTLAQNLTLIGQNFNLADQTMENSNLAKNTALDHLKTFLVGRGSDSLSYQSAWNTPLTLFNDFGILVALAWFVLLFYAWKLTFKQDAGYFAALLLALSLTLGLFIPTDTPLLVLQTILLTFYLAARHQFFTPLILKSSKQKKLASLAFYLPMFCVLFGIFWVLFRLNINYLAYFYHEKSLRQIADLENSNVLNYYDSASKAVNLAPHIDAFNRHAATANLEMALTGQNQENYLTTALDYANRATTINPDNATNWLILGHIYQDLAELTTDPISAYTQAIRAYANVILHEPANPNGYLLVGQIYALQQNYPEANSFFTEALTHLDKNSPTYPENRTAIENLISSYER